MAWAKRLAPLFSLAVFAGALLMLHHLLRHISSAEVTRRLAATPPRALLSGLMLTASSYLALAGFDGLGASYIGRRVAPARIVLISFISHAVSQNAGFATLTGGAIRYRMYSAIGLSPGDVAAVVAFCGLTFGLGASTMTALALLVEPHLLSAALRLPAATLRWLGIPPAAAVLGYFAWTGFSRRPLRLFRRSYPVPHTRIAALQVVVAAADLALASATLFVLLPSGGHAGYPSFVGAYVVANLLGLLAHVPGGLGVFDATILALTPGLPPESVVGALLLFRGLYNLLPLSLAAGLLLVYEVLERIPAASRRVGGLVDEVGPPLLAILAFVAGSATVLVHALAKTGPPAAEVFASVESAAGCVVMLMAHGLSRRSRPARQIGLACLLVLAALVLARNPFAPQGIALGLLAVLLGLSASAADDRRAARPLLLPWMLPIGAIQASACWLTWWRAQNPSIPAAAIRPAVWADGAALTVYAFTLAAVVASFAHSLCRSKGKPFSN